MHVWFKVNCKMKSTINTLNNDSVQVTFLSEAGLNKMRQVNIRLNDKYLDTAHICGITSKKN